MAKEMILKLHKDKDTNACTLDSQDIYHYITEKTEEEVELALYIDKWCSYLNHSVLNNNEMAFGDVDLARLDGWITGYNFAKKIEVTHFPGKVEIKMTDSTVIILEKPFVF